jgi:hypothetical protein
MRIVDMGQRLGTGSTLLIPPIAYLTGNYFLTVPFPPLASVYAGIALCTQRPSICRCSGEYTAPLSLAPNLKIQIQTFAFPFPP